MWTEEAGYERLPRWRRRDVSRTSRRTRHGPDGDQLVLAPPMMKLTLFQLTHRSSGLARRRSRVTETLDSPKV